MLGCLWVALELIPHKVLSVWTGISGCSELEQIHPVNKPNCSISDSICASFDNSHHLIFLINDGAYKMQWSCAQIRTMWKRKISERAIGIPKENWWYIVDRHNNTTITFFKLKVKSCFLDARIYHVLCS